MFKQYAVNEVVATYKSTRIRQRKGEEIEIEVPLSISASKGNLWVLVILPARYPIQKPIIQILNAKVCHKFIGKNYQINHPMVANWTQQSSLLFALKSIHSEFDKCPPQLEKKAANEEQKASEVANAKKSLLFKKPSLADATLDLEKLSNEELQKLSDNDEAFEKYFLQIKGVRELGESFSKLMKSLKSQAEENMKSKEEIDKLYSEYMEVRKEYEDLKEQEQEIMLKLSKENIINALEMKISDSQSE
jgi:myosin heavy subunit